MMIFLLSCAPSINSTNIDSFNTFFYLTDKISETIDKAVDAESEADIPAGDDSSSYLAVFASPYITQ